MFVVNSQKTINIYHNLLNEAFIGIINVIKNYAVEKLCFSGSLYKFVEGSF